MEGWKQMDKKLLKSLYAIHSPSGKENEMREFLISRIRAQYGINCIVDEIGNVYVTKGIADTYPCVVAHIDQVQRLHSDDFRAVETNGIIFGYSAKNHRFEGLGADDKNGVFVALECLKEFDVMKCAFFVGEEIGCIGSSECDMIFFDDCRFVLQCDRRNGDDLITHISERLCSDEFLADADFADFGYKETFGAMTDVETLKSNGLAVSCVNMSCGYYNPHTDEEFTDIAELENCLNFVKHVIRKCVNVYPHEPQYKSYLDGYNSRWDFSDYDFEEDMKNAISGEPDITAETLMEYFEDVYPDKELSDYEKALKDWHEYNDDAEFPINHF